MVEIDCNHSCVDQQNEPKRRRVNHPEHTIGGDSIQKTHNNRRNTNQNVIKEQISENTVIDENSNISAGIIQLLKNKPTSKLNELMDTFLNEPRSHFTGHANILFKNNFIGVICMEHLHIQIIGEEKVVCKLIAVDAEARKILAIWTAKLMENILVENDLSGIEKEGIIDLNNTGCYWEGGVMNGCECCGYGKEFNDENNLVYEGFMFGGKRVCYGKEYRGICDKNGKNGLVYEGGYWNGVRYGIGKSYDLNGSVEYEGEWVDNVPVNELSVKLGLLKRGNDLLLPIWSGNLAINKELFNDKGITSLHLSSLFHRLKKLEIGNKCFQYVRTFALDGLEKLESVKIGLWCFRISDERHDAGVCRIMNCPNLRRLDIGNHSFEYFHQFELSNVNSLQSIKIGHYCFENVREFVLDGLKKLESVEIGEECFRISDEKRDDGVCRITNCPNLTQLDIGSGCFGDFKQFELSNVNSLQSITFGENCFRYADCILKG